MNAATMQFQCFARPDLEGVLGGTMSPDPVAPQDIVDVVSSRCGRDTATVRMLVRRLRSPGDRVFVAGHRRADSVIVRLV